MEYRKLGKLDFKPSALGFGCMRLPTKEGTPLSPNIMEDDAVDLLRYAIDNGVNYIDTAYLYHSGSSEIVTGKALKNGYRQKVKLATKSPMMIINKAEDFDRILDDQLRKLDVDFIDFYLLHALNEKTWDIIKREDILGKAESAQKAGKIGHICFSFHDKYDVFEEIVTGYDKWAMCQIQYNFMDTGFQAGTKGLKLAASRDIGVVVMEPLRGGRLANPIDEVKALMRDRHYEGSIVNLAFRWLWEQPEVSVVLSGMTAKDHLEENLRFAGQSADCALTAGEKELINEITKIYDSRDSIPCTACSYCMPCPENVNIPQAINIYNEGVVYGYFDESKRTYGVVGRPAEKCVGCKQCEEKCPQSINISEWMEKIHKKLN